MDTISDMLIRIKNAQAVKKDSVEVPHSKLRMEIAKILQTRGFIGEIAKRGKKLRKSISINLAYGEDGAGKINGLRRLSKLSKRVYKSARELRPVRNGTGMAIISTSKGLVTDDEARKKHLGGEVFFEIW
ncbi:MAG: 30S ribosomal protein S8 [Candidatus Niyogibacteria bacterium]|nr:30S ribosomal protein S8 [Candidatus Niyogibacteria bacterium]